MDNDKYIVSFNIAGWAWKHANEKWEYRLKERVTALRRKHQMLG